jgi:RNA polymerase sigma-70 factor (ECF subfamily)
MLATRANGQPAAVCYTGGSSGGYQAYGVVVLTVTVDGISRIVSFGDASLVPAFGFPPTLSA